MGKRSDITPTEYLSGNKKMAWKQILVFKCTECERTYEVLPTECICVKQRFYKGRPVGSFIIESPPDQSGDIEVVCILCGMTTRIHYTNVKKQVSCGCKPKYIELLAVDKEVIRYRCKRCNSVHNVIPPIVTYCCEEADQGDSE